MDDFLVGYGYNSGISYPVRPSSIAHVDYGMSLSGTAGHYGHVYQGNNRPEPFLLHNRRYNEDSENVSLDFPSHRPVSAVGRVASMVPVGDALYPAFLVNLDRETKENMRKLQRKLTSRDQHRLQVMKHLQERQRSGILYSSEESENKLSLFLPAKEINRIGWDKPMSDTEDDDSQSNSAYSEATGFGHFCYLCSTLNEHQRHLIRKGHQMKPKQIAKPRVKYVAPPPKIKKKNREDVDEDEEDMGKTVYRVLVKTGKHRQAGTSANVFIELKGSLGVSKKKQLTRKHSIRFTFGVDTTEVFYVKTLDVGTLEALLVEHDGQEKQHSWYLEKIEVTDMVSGEHVFFPCNAWLSLHLEDKRLMRILKPASGSDLIDYEVEVYTGNVAMAGTNANVFITFYGQKGTSARLQLKNKQGTRAFQRAAKDVFNLTLKDVGQLTSLRIEHDNTGSAPGWFLDKILVKIGPKRNRSMFPCGQWLAMDEGDGKLCRTLEPVEAHGKKGGTSETEYKVQVFTGNLKNAGTDANVYITLYGTKGTSARLSLHNRTKNDFEKGNEDSFVISTTDIGTVNKLKIEHDNSGIAPGWFLEKVILTNLSTGKAKTFPCAQWLAKDEGDGSIARTIFPLGSTGKDLEKLKDGSRTKTYDVQVTTGSVTNAGTDANVFLTLHGLHGTTTKTQLRNKATNNFEKGKTDAFEIEVEDIGEISSIRIEHDNSGIGPGWFLDKILITDRKSRRTYEFPCRRWLASDEDDGMISRKLYHSEEERPVSRAARGHDLVRF